MLKRKELSKVASLEDRNLLSMEQKGINTTTVQVQRNLFGLGIVVIRLMKKKLPGYKPYGKSMPKGKVERKAYATVKPKKGGMKKPSVSFKGYSYRSYSK